MDQAVSGVNKFWMTATSLPSLLREWRIQSSMALRLSDERGQADEQRNRDAQYETYRNQPNRNDQIDTSYRQSSDRVLKE